MQAELNLRQLHLVVAAGNYNNTRAAPRSTVRRPADPGITHVFGQVSMSRWSASSVSCGSVDLSRSNSGRIVSDVGHLLEKIAAPQYLQVHVQLKEYNLHGVT